MCQHRCTQWLFSIPFCVTYQHTHVLAYSQRDHLLARACAQIAGSCYCYGYISTITQAQVCVSFECTVRVRVVVGVSFVRSTYSGGRVRGVCEENLCPERQASCVCVTAGCSCWWVRGERRVCALKLKGSFDPSCATSCWAHTPQEGWTGGLLSFSPRTYSCRHSTCGGVCTRATVHLQTKYARAQQALVPAQLVDVPHSTVCP